MYIGKNTKYIFVREEEIDWCIYRIIADGDAKTPGEIGRFTNFESSIIESSLQRLIRAGLIGQDNDSFSVLPFQQILICRQIHEDENGPIYLENGMIKVKKDREHGM